MLTILKQATQAKNTHSASRSSGFESRLTFFPNFRYFRGRKCFEAIARNRKWFRWPQRCNGQTGLTGLGRRARDMETEHPGFLKFAAALVVLLFIVHRLQISHVNGYISILHLTHVQLSSKHQSLRR